MSTNTGFWAIYEPSLQLTIPSITRTDGSYDWRKWVDENPLDTFEKVVRRKVNEVGTPWNSLKGFPPYKIDTHKESRAIRYCFALSGISRENVKLEFSDDRLWLIVTNDEKQEEEWIPLRSTMKTSVSGRYWFEFDMSRFDYRQAKATWKDGILEVTIPLSEASKPHAVTID